MRFTATQIPGVVLIEPRVFGDERGFFMETWHRKVFAENGIDFDFVQDNHSLSGQGILRGLHYQVQNPQGKLVRVVAGEIFDVAVDLRQDSPCFGQWIGQNLSAREKNMLWIAPGLAHGFYVQSEQAEVVYKCTDFYAPDHERSLRWDDPDLGIVWPVCGEPVLSDKDRRGVPLAQAEIFAPEFTFRNAGTEAR